jgi:hypothetical protein
VSQRGLTLGEHGAFPMRDCPARGLITPLAAKPVTHVTSVERFLTRADPFKRPDPPSDAAERENG